MTASGLPLSLEKCLGSLLQDNALSSWRIFASDGGGHVVTIKMHPREVTRHGEQHTTVAGGWFRKGQARVKRDRQRWIDFQDRLENTRPCRQFDTRGVVPGASRGAIGVGGRSDDVCSEVCIEDDVVLTGAVAETDVVRATNEDISSDLSETCTCKIDSFCESKEEGGRGRPRAIEERESIVNVNKHSKYTPGSYTCTAREITTSRLTPLLSAPTVPEFQARESRRASEADEMETGPGGEAGGGSVTDSTPSVDETERERQRVTTRF